MSRFQPIVLAALLAALPLSGCALKGGGASAGHELKALLPENGEVQGFDRDGEASLGQGLSGLAAIMDGAADAYVKLSAEAGMFQDYTGPDDPRRLVTVGVFQAADAGGLYRGIYSGRAEPAPGLGEEARSRLELFAATALDFHQGPYYIELYANRGGPEASETLRAFAETISRRIRALP